jgi:hypothetical protein
MVVYCKDVNRRGDFSDIHFDFLGFQFWSRKTMWMKRNRRIFVHNFAPAASPKALTSISREIRRWALHHRSDKSLRDLAQMYNPCIRGWIGYYSHFYKTQMRPTLQRIDLFLIRWARGQVQASASPDQRRARLVRPASPSEPEALRPLAALPRIRPNIGSRVT